MRAVPCLTLSTVLVGPVEVGKCDNDTMVEIFFHIFSVVIYEFQGHVFGPTLRSIQ